MKKKIVALVLSALMVTGLVGCGSDNNSSTSEGSALKVGMVTDTGTIDDKSFNQGSWEGIVEAEKELGVSKKYLKPAGEKTADYLKSIGDQYDAGNKFIVAPGFKFETAIFEAQDRYKDAKFTKGRLRYCC